MQMHQSSGLNNSPKRIKFDRITHVILVLNQHAITEHVQGQVKDASLHAMSMANNIDPVLTPSCCFLCDLGAVCNVRIYLLTYRQTVDITSQDSDGEPGDT